MCKLLLVSFLFLTIPAIAQWSTPVRISDPNGCLNPQIITQGDTLHVIYSVLARFRGLGYVRSIDDGRTWSQEVELSDVDQTMSPIFPRIMAWHNELLAVWKVYFRNGYYRLNIGYSKSSDNGISWTPPAYILAHNLNTLNCMTAANNDSVVNVIYTFGDSILCNLRSTNFGATWSSSRELLQISHTFKPDQAAAKQFVHFSWDGEFDEADVPEVYYFRSTDYGLSWSENMSISSLDSYISDAPSICADEDGNPAISWLDFKYSPNQTTGDILARWSTDWGMTWGIESQATRSHMVDISDISWAQDTIRIVWMDWRSSGNNVSIYYNFVDDSVGIWSLEERIDNFEYIEASSYEPAIAVSNGIVNVVWYEDCCTEWDQECCGIYFSRNPAEPDAIVDDISLPPTLTLSAYPNPFNSATTITLSGAEQAEIGIYDIAGRLITTLHTVGGQALWDASGYSSGLYFARLAGEKGNMIKLVLLK
jgi:hypothetical protein